MGDDRCVDRRGQRPEATDLLLDQLALALQGDEAVVARVVQPGR